MSDIGQRSSAYLPEPVAVLLFDGVCGLSLVMLKVCGVVAPVEVGVNCTLTLSVLPFARLKVPPPVVTVNGGLSVPTVT